MNQSDEFYQILSNAMNFNTAIRQKAEEDINRLAQENLGLFLCNLSIKLSNEQIDSKIRQIASTIIKNLVQKHRQEWVNLNQELKNKIKEHVLSTLASQSLDIRKAAALTIAGICKIELPLGQWSEIFSVLVTTSNNENLYIQLSSLTALGFIFQEISPGDIDENSIANLLNCFYTILNKDTSQQEVIISTLYAVDYFLPFISSFLADKKQKNLFFELIRKYITHSNDEFRQKAIVIFLDLTRNAYDAFEDYIDVLTEFTVVIIQKDIEPHVILCLEIWCSIGEIEIARMQNGQNKNTPCLSFCEKESSKLLQVIFQHLVTNAYHRDDWTPSKGAATLLNILSQCCSYSVIQKVIQFIGENINSESYDNKHAALSAFQSILETIHKKEINELAINSLDIIIQCLTESSYPNHIKEISALVIYTITMHYANSIISQPLLFDKLFMTILGNLDLKQSNIVVLLCMTITALCQAFPKDSHTLQTSLLSKYLESVLIKLLNKSFEKKDSFDHDNNIALNCFLALSNLIDKSALDCQTLKLQLLQNLFQGFQSTFSKDFLQNEEMRYNYQSYIANSFSSFVRSMSLNENLVNSMFDLILNSFNERKAVYEDGISCITAIASVYGKKFTECMPKIIAYIVSILQNPSDANLCRKGILFVSEIINLIEQNFIPYGDTVIPLIIMILSNPDIDKDLKLISFNVISDYFFFCSNDAIRYYDSIMSLIGSALQAALTLPKNDDEMIEYFAKLRGHLIETLTIIFGLCVDLKRIDDFTKYVAQIVEFVHKINTDEYNPSFSLVKESIGLLADFCKNYGQEMKPLLDIRLIEKMLTLVKTQENEPLIANLISYSQISFNKTFNS